MKGSRDEGIKRLRTRNERKNIRKRRKTKMKARDQMTSDREEGIRHKRLRE